jgi:TonB family protein
MSELERLCRRLARPWFAVVVVLAAATCDAPRGPVEQPTPMPGPSPFVYPVELWDQRIQGESLLIVHITELGAVDSAYVIASSGFSEFDSAAVRGAHRLRFSPGKQDQRRVPMWTRLPVRFSIDTLEAVGLPAAANGSHE